MDYEEYLLGIVEDLRETPATRLFAKRLLHQWQEGFIPSRKEMKRLRTLKGDSVMLCARLQPDGSCIWLRKNAREQGLLEPGSGEKVICKRTGVGVAEVLWKNCPGFKRQA